MALLPGYSVTELKNVAVADPICEHIANTWVASYKTGQDFQIEVDVPDTSPGTVYGLNQTLVLAIRTGIYSKADGKMIQLWRTPPNTTFNFKGDWLDSDVPHSNHAHFPYYSSEAAATIKPRDSKTEDKDTYKVTLRMHKTPEIALPTQIQRKSNPDEKLTIQQLDVQEGYLITLLHDEDVKNGKPAALGQWVWEYKHAWTSCNEDDQPQFEPRPSFTRTCEARSIGHYNLAGPTLAVAAHHDHFRVLDKEYRGGSLGEVADWQTQVTDDWEACDA